MEQSANPNSPQDIAPDPIPAKSFTEATVQSDALIRGAGNQVNPGFRINKKGDVQVRSITIGPGIPVSASFINPATITNTEDGLFIQTIKGLRITVGGGTTSPDIIVIKAADEIDLTAPETFATGIVYAKSSTATPAGGAQAMGFGTANIGIFFGSGAPSISAVKGSLYLRTDGSGTLDRMYVNTNGSTTWTAVTTVA